jgi:hypothetical protein
MPTILNDIKGIVTISKEDVQLGLWFESQNRHCEYNQFDIGNRIYFTVKILVKYILRQLLIRFYQTLQSFE